jgi:hypothetical protein
MEFTFALLMYSLSIWGPEDTAPSRSRSLRHRHRTKSERGAIIHAPSFQDADWWQGVILSFTPLLTYVESRELRIGSKYSVLSGALMQTSSGKRSDPQQTNTVIMLSELSSGWEDLEAQHPQGH